MNAAIADAEPIRTAAAQSRLALLGADSPELMAHVGIRTFGARGDASAEGEISRGEPDPGNERPSSRVPWPPRGPASTALLTIGRPPRAVRV